MGAESRLEGRERTLSHAVASSQRLRVALGVAGAVPSFWQMRHEVTQEIRMAAQMKEWRGVRDG